MLKIFQSAIQGVLKCNRCTLEEQAIINVIKVNSNIKQEEIAKVINKSLRTVKNKNDWNAKERSYC